MITRIVRQIMLRIREWIKHNIIADGWQDADGFHYGKYARTGISLTKALLDEHELERQHDDKQVGCGVECADNRKV